MHKSSVIARMIKDSLSSRSITIYGDGSQTRDFLYIDDLVNLIMRVVISPESNTSFCSLFQVGTGQETTINSLAAILISAFTECYPSSIPDITYKDPLVGDVQRNYADISYVSSIFNWRPTISLNSGVITTLNYFLSSNASFGD